MFEDVCKTKTPVGNPCSNVAYAVPQSRYYFDSKEKKCKKLEIQCFGGIRNKFDTLEKCEKKCLPAKGM